jgi:dipeptidase E
MFFEGGNTYHLMNWMNKSGLTKMLPEYLKSKIYVGVSAGSMVTNKNLDHKISQIVYDEDFDMTEDMKGLGFVDFYFLPHMNSSYFRKVREDFIKDKLTGIAEKIYALDDNSALKIIDDTVEVVSEGDWIEIN